MSAIVADGQIEFTVELGIGRQAKAGVWDTGYWNSAVWAQSDTSLGDWVDVTCSVLDETLSLRSGADNNDGVVTHWDAATASFTLIGSQWNPWAGPYAGILGPGVAVRMRWRNAVGNQYLDGIAQRYGYPSDVDASAWFYAFTGGVDGEGYTWNPNTEAWRSTADLACTDDTRTLAAFDGVEQPSQGSQETTAQRITRILDTALWPSTRRNVVAGGVKMQSTTLAENAWTMLLAACDSDLGLMWLRRDGIFCFTPEGRVKPPTSVAALLVVCLSALTDMFGNKGDFADPNEIRNWCRGWWSGPDPSLSVLAIVNGALRLTNPANTSRQIQRRGSDTTFTVGVHVFPTQPGQKWTLGCTVNLDADKPLAFQLIAAFGQQPADVYGVFNNRVAYVRYNFTVTPGQPKAVSFQALTPTNMFYVTMILALNDTPPARQWWFSMDDATMRQYVSPDEIQMVTFEGGQPTITRNIVSISRQARDETDNPLTITVRDDGSIARYMPHAYQRTDLTFYDDTWTPKVANAVLAAGAWPSSAPLDVALSSRLRDIRASQLLLGLDFDQRIRVSDRSQVWNMSPIGFDVEISRREISGTVSVMDIGMWIGAQWDTAVWDADSWGFA
jgi:hypothetical protein